MKLNVKQLRRLITQEAKISQHEMWCPLCDQSITPASDGLVPDHVDAGAAKTGRGESGSQCRGSGRKPSAKYPGPGPHGNWSRSRLGEARLVESLEDDLLKMLRFAKKYAKLGWAVQEQFDDLINNENRSGLNPNAVAMIKREFGGKFSELDRAIKDYEKWNATGGNDPGVAPDDEDDDDLGSGYRDDVIAVCEKCGVDIIDDTKPCPMCGADPSSFDYDIADMGG